MIEDRERTAADDIVKVVREADSLGHLEGLSGRLNPPMRFMYCRYSVFFSLRTPYTLFPGTLVFFVLLNLVKPMLRRIISSTSSSPTGPSLSTSISSLERVAPDFASAAPLVEAL